VGGWVSLVMGIKEGTYCMEHWVLHEIRILVLEYYMHRRMKVTVSEGILVRQHYVSVDAISVYHMVPCPHKGTLCYFKCLKGRNFP